MFKEGSSTLDVKKTVKPDNIRQVISKGLSNKYTRIANKADIEEDFTILLTSSPHTSSTPEISPVATNNPVFCPQSEAVSRKSADLFIPNVNH